MSWRIKARYYEACNCALGCPCNMNGFPTHGFCEGSLAFEVTEGEKDAFVDGTPDQEKAIVSILTAEDPGLPWEVLAATVSEVHGPFFEKITIEGEGPDARITVGEKFDVQLQSFTDPVSGAKHTPHMVLADGFIFQDGIIATTTVNRLDVDGVRYEHPGNNAYYSEIEWSSENRMAPASTAGRF
jgi:hypothetical protein